MKPTVLDKGELLVFEAMSGSLDECGVPSNFQVFKLVVAPMIVTAVASRPSLAHGPQGVKQNNAVRQYDSCGKEACWTGIVPKCSSEEGFLGGAVPVYSQVAAKTTTVPGITMDEKLVSKSMGPRYKRIPVDTAVAKHLATASASTGSFVSALCPIIQGPKMTNICRPL